MQENPLITIILPCYNSELTVARCIESILHQTYTNFELLVINDGSTDLTDEIVKVYCRRDERVKVFSKDNGGVSSARNLGLDNATGEWVTFADSDDFATPYWLDNFVDLISPDVDLVGLGFQTDRPLYTNEDANHLRYGFSYFGDVEAGLKKMHSLGLVGFLWVKMFRKSIIDKRYLRFNTALSFKEDEEFVLRYFESATCIRLSDTSVYCYHVPDWTSKYTEVPYLLHEQLFRSIKSIYRNGDDSIVYDYLHRYLNEFLNCDRRPSIDEVLRVKRFVGVELLRTSYPLILKWTWYIDPTGYLSYLLISLYRCFKK